MVGISPLKIGLGRFISKTSGGTPTPPAEAQTLFDHAVATGMANAADTTGYTLGAVITFEVAGYVDAVYFYKPTGASQTLRRAAIYNTSGDLLRQGTIGEMTAEPAAGNWVAVSLDTPLQVTAGQTLVAAVTTTGGGTGGYAAQAGGFTTAVVRGDLTGEASGDVSGNGRFNDSSPTVLNFPTGSAGATNYWVDVRFFAGGTGASGIPIGYPRASNTGASGALPAYGGPLEITVDDTVVENVTVTGALIISASNVIIRNCAINFTDAFGIDGEFGPNLTVEDCTITGPGILGATNAGILGSGTFTGNKISGSENGIVLGAGASTVTDNYIFDMRTSAAVPHTDGITCQGVQDGVLIQHNTIISYDTSCIFIKDDFGAITDVTINDNVCLPDPEFGGPAFMIAIDVVTSITGITVTNNKLVRGADGYFADESGATVSGNTNVYSGLPV